MLRNIRSGVIHFKAINVPVGVATAVSSTGEPKFRTLHGDCKTPIKQKNFCETCDKEADETISGYEFAKGQFVTFTPEEFEEIERTPSIQIDKFIRASDIKPMMVANTYWLTPASVPLLAEAYGILYQSLAEKKRAGLGFHSLWGKEHPCVVIPNQDYEFGVLQLCTLNVGEDLVMPDFSAPIPGREEKKMMKDIIDRYSGDLNVTKDLVSESRNRLHAMVAARVEGKDLPEYEDEDVDSSTDLMESLRATYEEVQERRTEIKEEAKK